MGRRYDIIQTPKDMSLSDLPKNIEVSKPFMVGEHMYVCEKTGVSGLKVCNEEDGKNVKSSPSKHYYVIRRL